MTTGDASWVFLDTNVLVYANVSSAPLHSIALDAIRQHDVAGIPLWVSRQVFREYLATVTRRQTFMSPTPMMVAVERVRYFEARFRVAEDGPAVTQRLLALLEQVPVAGKQVHDANVVATMLAHGIRRLLTGNTADFARFAHLIEVLPLDTTR
jgi:predicted nucleic acid-binding protein